jgi:hypothetical protein
MNLLTSFKILGIPSDADETQAKRAYKAQVRRWHPDQFPEGSDSKSGAEEQLKQINIAYGRIKEHLATRGPSPASHTADTPRPETADPVRPAAGQPGKKSWIDALFDTLNAFSREWRREPSSPQPGRRPANRRKNFGEVLDEMAGGTISPPKGRGRRGIRRNAAGYRRHRGGGGPVDAVGAADRVGPVRPVGRVRGIGRRR